MEYPILRMACENGVSHVTIYKEPGSGFSLDVGNSITYNLVLVMGFRQPAQALQRSGMVNVDDVLVAINGESMIGKGFYEAITRMKATSHIVTLSFMPARLVGTLRVNGPKSACPMWSVDLPPVYKTWNGWTARMWDDQVLTVLGYYATLEEAEAALKQAVTIKYGWRHVETYLRDPHTFASGGVPAAPADHTVKVKTEARDDAVDEVDTREECDAISQTTEAGYMLEDGDEEIQAAVGNSDARADEQGDERSQVSVLQEQQQQQQQLTDGDASCDSTSPVSKGSSSGTDRLVRLKRKVLDELFVKRAEERPEKKLRVANMIQSGYVARSTVDGLLLAVLDGAGVEGGQEERAGAHATDQLLALSDVLP